MAYSHSFYSDPDPPQGGNGKHKGKHVKTKKMDKHRGTKADPEATDTDSTRYDDPDVPLTPEK